ncbi:hypothetical protein AB0885_35490 [Streptomyces sp. NPDC005534]|uniref:hypothetical protein n=1 Tax=Streptomyces sp. NPDC005534 TaxID=3155714 RepID=UPI00345442B2
MIAMIIGQLRRRRGRAMALAAGILVAATSFTLLTSTVHTSQAATVGTVRANARSSYDVLVRPPHSQTDVERESGLVASNFLSGTFGGITMEQYRHVQGMAGVEVAAPVANIGYLMVHNTVSVDVSRFLDSKASRQMLRLVPTLSAGLNTYRAADQYVYLTRSPITSGKDDLFESDTLEKAAIDKSTRRYVMNGKYNVCFYFNGDKSAQTNFNMELPLKENMIAEDLSDRSAFDPDLHSRLTCRSGRGKAVVDIPVAYPVLLSAVDPRAEDQLVGLRRTVTSGRMLTSQDRPKVVPPSKNPNGQRETFVPVVLSSRPLTSGRISAIVERLDTGDPAKLPSRLGNPTANTFVKNLRGATVGRVGADLSTGFRKAVPTFGVDSTNYWTVGPVTYRCRCRSRPRGTNRAPRRRG